MYQLVMRNKPRKKWYIRKLSDSITPNQARLRIEFGEISKRLKEEYGKLHPIVRAELIGEALRGREFGRTIKLRKWEEELLKELEGLSEEELKVLEETLKNI